MHHVYSNTTVPERSTKVQRDGLVSTLTHNKLTAVASGGNDSVIFLCSL